MDETRFDQSLKVFAGSAGRRDAFRSISVAGMALLAALGLAEGGEAKKKNGGNNHQNRNQAEKKKGGGKGKSKRGPTGPTGPLVQLAGGPVPALPDQLVRPGRLAQPVKSRGRQERRARPGERARPAQRQPSRWSLATPKTSLATA